MEIYPGIGIEKIIFGMRERHIIDLLGEPDDTYEGEHVEGNNDLYKKIFYNDNGLSFSFESEDEFKLGSISVTDNSHTLFGEKILGLDIEYIKKFLHKNSKLSKYEDCTWGKKDKSELLDVDSCGLLFWFSSGFLDEIICSYLFKSDNNTIIWPKIGG